MQIFSPRGNRLPEGINTIYVITFDLRILFFSNTARRYPNFAELVFSDNATKSLDSFFVG